MARRLRPRLGFLGQGKHSRGDFILGNGNYIVHVFGNHLKGQVAGHFYLDAVGNGFGVALGDLLVFKGDRHARGAFGLHAVNFAVGVDGLDGKGDARDQAAAADGHNHSIHVFQLLHDFQADSALASHDIHVVEGMGKGVAFFLLELSGPSGGVIVNALYQDNLSAVASGCLHFSHRGGSRHADDGFGAASLCGQCDALGVVAGGAAITPWDFSSSDSWEIL